MDLDSEMVKEYPAVDSSLPSVLGTVRPFTRNSFDAPVYHICQRTQPAKTISSPKLRHVDCVMWSPSRP